MKHQVRNFLNLITISTISKQGNCWMIGTVVYPGFVRKPTIHLHGILDEMNNNSGQVDTSSNDVASDPKYEKLFEEIVFCNDDSQRLITARLDDCADSGFLQWLEATQAKCEDAEEFQAIKDLRMTIDDIVKTKVNTDTNQQVLDAENEAKRKILEEETKRHGESSFDGANMSAADVLKKASEIDEGIVNALASEEDQPDDFMRDARSYCGLGGFSDSGKMRVGGD